MIAPLVPFAIKGAIWYQGEANVGRAKQYETLFPLMISDWRKQWDEGKFPFYFVQIAPFNYGGDSTAAAALRDAQRRTIEASENTGMAVTWILVMQQIFILLINRMWESVYPIGH